MYTYEWVLADTNQNLHWGIKGVPDSHNYPARSMGGVAWVDKNLNLWLFGGCDSLMTNISYNAMWRFNPKDGCLINSINDKGILKGISIFPNPFTDKFNIKAEENQNNGASIELYDLQGRKVYSNYYKPRDGIYQMSIENFTPGIYFLFFKNSEIKTTHKIIKM
jgi:hypothetical protein